MTLADVRSKTERIREFSALPFLLIATASAAGALFRSQPQAVTGGPLNAGDVAWMLTATGLVLLMTPGLSFFYGGMVRTKNVVSTMMQSFVAMAVISILWIVVGFSLAFGTSFHGVIGDPRTFFMFTRVGALTHPDLAPTIPLILFALFQLKFAIITPALITGSFAERVRFTSYLLFMCLFSLFIYAPLAHWTWHPDGFLHKLGVLDFAGGTVVHMSAGLAALAGAIVLGRRRTHEAGEAHTPANIPFVILGTGMLWFGWFGFNAGSTLAAVDAHVAGIAVNTLLASAAGGFSALLLVWSLLKKPDLGMVCNGYLGGLVAITASCAFVSPAAAVFIGVVAGLLVVESVIVLERRFRIDDPVGAVSVHGVCGVWGALALGLFADGSAGNGWNGVAGPVRGLIFGDPGQLAAQAIGVLTNAVVVFALAYGFFKLTDRLVGNRVPAEVEWTGLDPTEMGSEAYPPG